MADLPVPLYYVQVAVHHHKIFVTGNSPVKDAKHQVYVYNINTDHWGQLPPPGQCNGIPHIIGDKLAIIGGCNSATNRRTNKVSTFDEGSQTWTSYYPDLLSVRSVPGVVSHLKYVIVAGGRSIDYNTILDDMKVLSWLENSHWRRVSIKLPIPLYEFIPTISDDHLIIVGYYGDKKARRGAYKLPVANIIASIEEQHKVTSSTLSRWTELTEPIHLFTVLVPNSSPPVVVGGWNHNYKTSTADIKMYDNSDHSWRKVGSLSSAKLYSGVAAIDNNAVIIIGGCTRAGIRDDYKSSSLTVVELGQAELLY